MVRWLFPDCSLDWHSNPEQEITKKNNLLGGNIKPKPMPKAKAKAKANRKAKTKDTGKANEDRIRGASSTAVAAHHRPLSQRCIILQHPAKAPLIC